MVSVGCELSVMLCIALFFYVTQQGCTRLTVEWTAVGEHIEIGFLKFPGLKKLTTNERSVRPQKHSLLSKHNAHRLKLYRFVSTTGKPGRNHSCDLEMKHWNAALK